MMLSQLTIHQLRNIQQADLHPGPKFNIIHGANGSGKTTILEAIHLLSLGRSFRTHLTNRLINHQHDHLTLFSRLGDDITLGIQRDRSGNQQIKLADKPVNSSTELARQLPVQLIEPNSHRLLTDGPKLRRQFIDWGVFHVEHSFFSLWQRTQRLLKQRNAALKAHAPLSEIELWDKDLAETAEKLTEMRANYIDALQAPFMKAMQVFFNELPIEMRFYRGWNKEKTLEVCLKENLNRDRMLGYTQSGPHRANLLISTNQVPVADGLSQGQQKLVVYALRLAQGMLANKPCIYLVDDLPAELDIHKRARVAEVLKSLDAQVFVTGTEKSDLNDFTCQEDSKMFHVEHGTVISEK